MELLDVWLSTLGTGDLLHLDDLDALTSRSVSTSHVSHCSVEVSIEVSIVMSIEVSITVSIEVSITMSIAAMREGRMDSISFQTIRLFKLIIRLTIESD